MAFRVTETLTLSVTVVRIVDADDQFSASERVLSEQLELETLYGEIIAAGLPRLMGVAAVEKVVVTVLQPSHGDFIVADVAIDVEEYHGAL